MILSLPSRRRVRLRSAGLAAAGLLFAAVSSPGESPDHRLVRQTEPLAPEEQRERLRVPEGFEVQLFAAEPMIHKPINLAFDERGRLWVSSTTEYPHAAERGRWEDEAGSRVRGSRDAIKILEDTNGDGRADRATDFADGLNIPTGVLPWRRPGHAAGCIAWSIPNIWYLADTDGDGRCDHREVLFGPLGYEKDTHGMCSSFRLGPDGWVYATHGFNNTSRFRVRPENLRGARPGDPGTELDLESGNVFRFLPDGSRVEIWSWGQVNPFGLAFDRRGYLYSADCHSAPVYQLLRGAHYPSFGKPHDGLGYGPVMIEHTHGSTGICGIAWIDGGAWGEDWDDTVLIGNVVTSRINRDSIAWRGATPSAQEEPDFLVSEDPWFRPVDLRLGPDGALYVADFYNRVIGHYEVPLDHPGRDRERGRIWRVVKTSGAAGPPPAPRPLAPGDTLAALREGGPHETRAAAAACQAEPSLETLPALLSALDRPAEDDTHLRHALRLAIREHLKLPGAFGVLETLPRGSTEASAGIALAVPSAEAAAFLAERASRGGTGGLDQLDGAAVAEHLGRHGRDDVSAAAEILAAERHPDDPAAQARLLASFHEGRMEREGEVFTPGLRGWAERLAGELLGPPGEDGAAGWRPAPGTGDGESPWTAQERPRDDGATGLFLSSLRRGEPGAEQRVGTLRSPAFAAPRALSFWICGHRGPPAAPAHEKNRVRLVAAGTGEEIASAFPPRSDTARQVRWDLSSRHGESVVLEIIDGDNGGAYAWLGAGGFEPPHLMPQPETHARGESREAALRLLAGVLRHEAPALLRERLAPWLPAPPPPPPEEVDPGRRAELDALIAARAGAFDPASADAGRGLAVYRLHCAACHRIGGEGGLVGPQLDGAGLRGVERLSEDILDPGRNVDAHFRLQRIALRDGAVLGGFVRSETGRVIRLMDAAGTEHRVPKAGIVSRETSALSLMPAGYGELLPEADFHDLLAYLLER